MVNYMRLRIGPAKRLVTGAGAAVVLSLVLAGCGASSGAGGSSGGGSGAPDTLRFAVTDLQGLEELQRDFGPFQKEMENVLGVDVEFFPVSSRPAAAEALRADKVDLVLTGPAEYVVMRERSEAEPLVGLTRPGYRGAIAVREGSGIESAGDLKGKSVAMSDAGSTSGHLAPCKVLMDADLECGTADVDEKLLGDGYTQAFLNEDVDALADSPLGIEEMREEGGLSKEETPIIAEGPDLPNDIFVANPELPKDFREGMRKDLIDNEQELIDALIESGANDKYEESELVEAKDSEYDYIREAYKAIGVDDTSEFVG